MTVPSPTRGTDAAISILSSGLGFTASDVGNVCRINGGWYRVTTMDSATSVTVRPMTKWEIRRYRAWCRARRVPLKIRRRCWRIIDWVAVKITGNEDW